MEWKENSLYILRVRQISVYETLSEKSESYRPLKDRLSDTNSNVDQQSIIDAILKGFEIGQNEYYSKMMMFTITLWSTQ